MDGQIAFNITKRAVDRVEKPDFTKLNLKSFDELFFNGKTAWQIFFYNRTDKHSNCDRTHWCFESEAELNLLLEQLKDYNEKLKLAQEEELVVEETERNFRNRRTYLSFYNIGTDIGYCHISYFERNKEREEKEERAEWDNMTEEEKEAELKPQGPYGGAFASYEDFHNWKEK